MNLRGDIAQAIELHLVDTYGYECTKNLPAESLDIEAAAILAVLAGAASDPVRLRAILELIGLEVTDGIWFDREDNVDMIHAQLSGELPRDYQWKSNRVLVCRVRPQGEADHA